MITKYHLHDCHASSVLCIYMGILEHSKVYSHRTIFCVQDIIEIDESCVQSPLTAHTSTTRHPINETSSNDANEPSVSEGHALLQPSLCDRDKILYAYRSVYKPHHIYTAKMSACIEIIKKCEMIVISCSDPESDNLDSDNDVCLQKAVENSLLKEVQGP